jgi:CheY-like chemotaxis protein
LYKCLLNAIDDSVEISTIPTSQTSAPALRFDKHILLAEDNSINQEITKTMLLNLGCQVTVVDDGLQAWQAFLQHHYDLVLMDCHMPNLDGFDTSARIRQWEHSKPNYQHTPIIALTASAMRSDHEHCIAAGMDDYLVKPLKTEDLKKMLVSHFGLPKSFPMTISHAIEKADPLPKTEEQKPMSDDNVLSAATITHLRKEMKDRGIGWLIDLFINELPKYIEALQQAITNDDGEALYLAAHKFKGSCSNMGAVGMVNLCRELETLGRAGEIQQAARMMTNEVNQEIERLKTAFEQEKQRENK